MGDIRPGDLYTRRAALTLAAAVPALGQAEKKGHPIVHFEIGCRDRAKSEAFFSSLFDWHIQANDPAGTIDTGSTHGIPGHIASLGHEPQHYTMFYVEVEDVQAYLDKAVALGGKMLVPPVKTPAGTFAWLSDPDGNMLGLLKR